MRVYIQYTHTWHFQPCTAFLSLMKMKGLTLKHVRENGGPLLNSSQRAGQLGTSLPSNHPAVWLNLQLCSQWGLKRQHGEHIYQETSWILLGCSGRELEVWGVDRTSSVSSGFDHRGTWLMRCKKEWSCVICGMGMKTGQSVVLIEWMHKVTDIPTYAALTLQGKPYFFGKIMIRGCWVKTMMPFKVIFLANDFSCPYGKRNCFNKSSVFAQCKCYWLQIITLECANLFTCVLMLPSSKTQVEALRKSSQDKVNESW